MTFIPCGLVLALFAFLEGGGAQRRRDDGEGREGAGGDVGTHGVHSGGVGGGGELYPT